MRDMLGSRRWRYPRVAAEGQPAAPPPPQNTAAASASAVPASSPDAGSDAGGVVWRRPEQAEAAAGPPLPAGGSGLAEAGFPEAGGVFPMMPSPWDDPEFYTLGLHMGPPPPPPLLGGAAATAAAAASAETMPGAAEPVQQGGMLRQRDAQLPEPAAENSDVLWRREADSPEHSALQQGGVTPSAAAGDASPSNGSDSGKGGPADGSATTLPPRPMRMPIIPSRRMRGSRGGVPAAANLQDDPAVLDNLEDSGTSQRRPMAAAGKSGGAGQ